MTAASGMHVTATELLRYLAVSGAALAARVVRVAALAAGPAVPEHRAGRRRDRRAAKA